METVAPDVPHVHIDGRTTTVVGIESAKPRSVSVTLGEGAYANGSGLRSLDRLAPALIRSLWVARESGIRSLQRFDGAQLDELVLQDRGVVIPDVTLTHGGRVEIWYPDDTVNRLLGGHLSRVALRGGGLTRIEARSIDRLHIGHCTRLVELRGRVASLLSNVCTRLILRPADLVVDRLCAVRRLGMPIEDVGALDCLDWVELHGVSRLAAVDVERWAPLRRLRLAVISAADSTVRRFSSVLPGAWCTNSLGVWRGGVRVTDPASLAEVARARATYSLPREALACDT